MWVTDIVIKRQPDQLHPSGRALVESPDNGSGGVAVQITGDRIDRADRGVSLSPGIDERGARRALRAQIAKLERELAEIVAEGFPHIASPARPRASARRGLDGAPCLLDLGRLERTRDELAGDVQAVRRATAQRAELETRARELLEAMRREPARYKFVRLPVRDLGEGGCGVWEVRPRLGLLGMLAGWWQVKLSSGCPLAAGHAARRDPEIIQSPRRAEPRRARSVVPRGVPPARARGRMSISAQTVAHGPRTGMSASRRSRRE